MSDYTIGQKIRKFRFKAGLTQLDLELEIDASSGSISRIESGNVNPTKETLFSISKALKLNEIETAYLFGIIDVNEHTWMKSELNIFQ
ncbi:MAG: helix-turn-helix domain-containing protein [Candidatus Dojkabacteria bacterium]